MYQENDFAPDFTNFTFKILVTKELETNFRQSKMTYSHTCKSMMPFWYLLGDLTAVKIGLW